MQVREKKGQEEAEKEQQKARGEIKAHVTSVIFIPEHHKLFIIKKQPNSWPNKCKFNLYITHSYETAYNYTWIRCYGT